MDAGWRVLFACARARPRAAQAGRSATFALCIMKRFWPLIALVLGLFLVLAGFVYELMLSDLLFPGSTPETHARYLRLVGVAHAIKFLGQEVFLVGVLLGVIPFTVRRFRPPAAQGS